MLKINLRYFLIFITGISLIQSNPLFANYLIKGCNKNEIKNNLYDCSISEDDLRIDKGNLKNLAHFKVDNLDIDKILDGFLFAEKKLPKKRNQKFSYEILSDTQYTENEIFYAEGNVEILLQYGVFKADKISYDRKNKVFKATNNLKFESGRQIVNADYLFYDFNSDSGYIDDVYGVIDFKTIKNDLNQENFIFDDKKSSKKENDLIDIQEEVELLNTNNARLKNSFGLDGFSFDFSQISQWRFKSEKISLEKDEWRSDLIYFTNDPYNEPQFVLTSKDFLVKTVDEKTKFISKSTSVNFDNKFSLPLGKRTITDGEVYSRWGLGYETKDKDGLYILRSLDPIRLSDDFVLEATPYLLIQRIISGETNSFRGKGSSVISENIKNDIQIGDYFGINAEIKGKINNDFDFNADIDIKTLNPNKFYDAFSLDLNLLKNIYSSSKVKGVASNNVKSDIQKSNDINLGNYDIDFGIYTRFDQDDIYLGYGGKLVNRYNFSKNNLTKDYSIVFDVGAFQGKGLSNNNELIKETRYGTNISFMHSYKIADFNNYEDKFTSQFKNTPKLVDQGLFLNGKFASGIYEYSNSKSQAVYSFGIGPSFTYGKLKKNYFDYSKISIMPEFIIKNGKSPFKFDDFNNDSRIKLDLKQQIFGPIIFGFQGNLNLNTNSSSYGKFENKTYSLGISRRAYSIDLGYNQDEKSVLLGFSIFNFDFNKLNDKFKTN